MGALLSAVSNALYIGEKVAMWLAASMVMTCLIVTLIVMLGLGVGLGYNYCFVDIKTKYKYVPGHYEYQLIRSRKGAGRMSDLSLEDVSLLNNDSNSQVADVTGNTNNTTTKNITTLNNPDVDRNHVQDTKVSTEKITELEMSNPSKTVVQIDGLDLIALLSKLKAENRNYTLQIVTT